MSKSRELHTTTDIVRPLLRSEPKARNSDNYLYLRVLQTIGDRHGLDIDNMPVVRFFLELSDFGFLPAFETVRRTRQKLQASYPELAADCTVEGYSMLNEEVYRNYARGMV